MIAKLLGLIFNRWVLLAILLLAVSLVVWIAGPLVGLTDRSGASWFPLEPESARWITIASIAALTAIIVAWRAWRAKSGNAAVVNQLMAQPAGDRKEAESPDMLAVRQRFEKALLTLRRARFGAGGGVLAGWKAKLNGRYLYELPWYLIIGAPGSGKTTALRHSGLKFPLADVAGEDAIRGVGGTRNCDWWFTDQAVLIDTAGRFTTQDSDRENDRSTWSGFLAMLKRSRPRQPVNGVLVTVSVSDLLTRTLAERRQYAATVRQRLQELHEGLGIRFRSTCSSPRPTCSPASPTTSRPSTRTSARRRGARPSRSRRLRRRTCSASATSSTRSASGSRTASSSGCRWSATPRSAPASTASPASSPACAASCRNSSRSPSRRRRTRPTPCCAASTSSAARRKARRSIASSARSRAATASSARSSRPNQASGRSYFLSRLLGEVVFAESGLANTDLKWERRRTGLVVAGYAAIAAVTVGALAAWGSATRTTGATSTRSRRGSARCASSCRARPIAPRPTCCRSCRRWPRPAASRERATRCRGSSAFGLYQGPKLDSAARGSYQRMLVDAMLPRIGLRVEEQLRQASNATRRSTRR
jgi:type VI secretion system protein ImpL